MATLPFIWVAMVRFASGMIFRDLFNFWLSDIIDRIVDLFFQNKADVNARNNDGDTTLHIAALRGNLLKF